MKHQPALAPSPIVTGTRRSCVADVITAFSTGVAFDELPAAAIEAAKRSILDTLAVAVAGGLLVYEHRLVRSGDYSRLDAAFFTMNGVISGVVMLGAVADALR